MLNSNMVEYSITLIYENGNILKLFPVSFRNDKFLTNNIVGFILDKHETVKKKFHESTTVYENYSCYTGKIVNSKNEELQTPLYIKYKKQMEKENINFVCLLNDQGLYTPLLNTTEIVETKLHVLEKLKTQIKDKLGTIQKKQF